MPGQQNWWFAWWMQEAVATSGWTTGGRLPFRSSAVLRLSWGQGATLRWCPGRRREDLRMFIQTQIWQDDVHPGWYRVCTTDLVDNFLSWKFFIYIIFLKETLQLLFVGTLTKSIVNKIKAQMIAWN